MAERVSGRADASDERRASDRLPVIRNVRYKVLGKKSPALVGSGETLNMSGNGVLFTTKSALPAGASLELVVSWPPRLNGVPLELVLLGRLVRTEETQAAISILRYDFRTR